MVSQCLIFLTVYHAARDTSQRNSPNPMGLLDVGGSKENLYGRISL